MRELLPGSAFLKLKLWICSGCFESEFIHGYGIIHRDIKQVTLSGGKAMDD
jgi:hypothetical protein